MSDLVPEGWKETSIGKITSTNSLFSDGDWVESKDQDPAGTNRLIQLADIGDSVFINKSSRYMNDEQFQRLKCTSLNKNDILIARMPDPLGRACLYPLESGKAATVVDVAILRTENADHYWLMSAINSSNYRYQIDLNASGTTRTRIARGILSEIKILEPPLTEQQKIATILSSVDDVIEKIRAQVDKLKDLKTGMMQELLTKGIGHTEFKDSPVGRIPATWAVKSISDVCSEIVDCVNKTATIVDYVTPYKMIRTTNVRDGRIIIEGMRYVTEETFNVWSRRLILKNGDVIFTREAPVGECGLVTDATNLFLGQRTMVYRADSKKINNLFLLSSMQSEYFQSQIEDLSGGSTTPHLRVPDCGKILLKVPTMQEQQQISMSIQSVDRAQASKQNKLELLGSIKKALMQDLLTGKVRVNLNESAAT